MSEPAPVKSRVSLRRIGLWSLGGLIVLGFGLFGLDQVVSSRRSKTMLGSLEETDPGWRLEEIEAARATVPEPQNSAALLRELGRLLGKGWPDSKFDERMSNLVLPERFDAARFEALEDEMKRLETIRLVARPLADMPRGRHQIDHAFHPLATMLSDQQRTREVVNLFRYEMLYLSNKGDISSAVRSGRACVCAGRSLYDEPLLISQLIRAAIVQIGLEGVEAALSLGESNEFELIALETLLAEEEVHNSLLVGLRGERATMARLFARLGSGAISTDGLHDELGMGKDSLLRRFALYPRWQVRRQEPIMLDLMTRFVENARLPAHEQIAGEQVLEREVNSKKLTAPLVAALHRSPAKVGNIFRRKTASVASMRALIAVERFRRKYEKWPAKLTDVVPEFLKVVPTDPFDGAPLQMARVPDGVVVYSVGADGVDDAGKLDRKHSLAPGTDIGFQLWDREKRRKSASPRPASEENP